MLRLDLEAAGIPYHVPGPDGPLYADFHSLRHSYITALGRGGGVDLRTAQEPAGHSTPMLTARYTHRRLYDLAGAVEKLPRFLPSDVDEAMGAPLAATGTGGASLGCTGVARTLARSHHLVTLEGTEREEKRVALETTQPLVAQGSCPRQSSAGIVGLEGG
jgi:hypothetical protein